VKKVKNRALYALLPAAITILGLLLYIGKFTFNGNQWASATFNGTVYRGGVLTTGTLTDRNGVVLAGIDDGKRTFADSAETRRATLHAVGDLHGNIGTGALTIFAPELMGYNILTGAYSRTGEGKTAALTIDSRLNVEAYKALDGRRGAVMVINYKTGEILCMVSSPTFDPLSPPTIVDGDAAFEGVYLNRSISSAYTPGSTFKLLTAVAAIESIRDLPDRVFECDGSLKTDSGEVTCIRAHGKLAFDDALAVSCNVVFGSLALEIGANKLSDYAGRAGLSGRGTVGAITTASGNFDKAEPGTADLAWSGIGQYNNTVCPASMLRFVGAIANGGVATEMSLLEKTGISAIFSARTSRIMRNSTAVQLGEMMDYHSQQNFPGLEMRAKSGTAEVGGGKSPHAWFTGFIENEGYPLAFVVVVENGGGGTAIAGPIANRVLQAYIKVEQ